MTGENATAIFHFFDNGIYIECEDLDIGKFVTKGDGNAIMDILNDIDNFTDPNTTFKLTEKGKELLNKLNKDKV